jgi:hypothetical protein
MARKKSDSGRRDLKTDLDFTIDCVSAPKKHTVLLSPRDASNILKKSIAWLARDRWSGPTIPFNKGPGKAARVLYDLADIEAHIAANRHTQFGGAE